MCVCVSVYLFVCLSVCIYLLQGGRGEAPGVIITVLLVKGRAYESVCLCVCLSIYLFVCLFVCLSASISWAGDVGREAGGVRETNVISSARSKTEKPFLFTTHHNKLRVLSLIVLVVVLDTQQEPEH